MAAVRRSAKFVVVAVGVVSMAGCGSDPAYEGIGTDHGWVGSEIQPADRCDVRSVINADACVDGTPVRVVWRDGDALISDASCKSGRMNVAVRGSSVLAAWQDCDDL